MTRILIILAALALSGCAGLSVNFDAGITYRSAVPPGGRSDTPAAQPVITIVPLPAPVAPGAAS